MSITTHHGGLRRFGQEEDADSVWTLDVMFAGRRRWPALSCR